MSAAFYVFLLYTNDDADDDNDDGGDDSGGQTFRNIYSRVKCVI